MSQDAVNKRFWMKNLAKCKKLNVGGGGHRQRRRRLDMSRRYAAFNWSGFWRAAIELEKMMVLFVAPSLFWIRFNLNASRIIFIIFLIFQYKRSIIDWNSIYDKNMKCQFKCQTVWIVVVFGGAISRCLFTTPHPGWLDLAIFWTLGNFLKPLATINLPKSPNILRNVL